MEEARIDGVVVGDLLQGLGAEDARHLGLERFREQAVDVVVAIVDEQEAAALHVTLDVLALGRRELHQLVAGEIAERRLQHLRVRQRDDAFDRIDAQGRVLDQRIEHVAGHADIHVPVARLVSQAREIKIVVGINRAAYTASDKEVKLKSRSFIGGIIIWYGTSSPEISCERPSSSILFNIATGLSLKRKFLIGCLILPSSM